jgi:predicted enzyme related to lactoylglutathione lyase
VERFGATCVRPPHDEGFGLVASFTDPEGNPFELVELSYDFHENGA